MSLFFSLPVCRLRDSHGRVPLQQLQGKNPSPARAPLFPSFVILCARRELARIKQEREQEAARKAVEDKAREEAEKKEALLRGNPLLASSSFAVKRRWDDDHVFRNQVPILTLPRPRMR